MRAGAAIKAWHGLVSPTHVPLAGAYRTQNLFCFSCVSTFSQWPLVLG